VTTFSNISQIHLQRSVRAAYDPTKDTRK
jgi:hypothetical protein